MGRMAMKSARRVLGHSLVRLLIRSHRPLSRSLRIARFARALRGAQSCARLLTHSRAHGKEVYVYVMNATIPHSFYLIMIWGSSKVLEAIDFF